MTSDQVGRTGGRKLTALLRIRFQLQCAGPPCNSIQRQDLFDLCADDRVPARGNTVRDDPWLSREAHVLSGRGVFRFKMNGANQVIIQWKQCDGFGSQ